MILLMQPTTPPRGTSGWPSRHPILTFYAITLLYSWSLWFLMILSAKGLLPFHFPTSFIGSFGPAIGAILAAAILGGKGALRVLLYSAFNGRFPIRYYLFSLAGPFLLYITAIAAASFYTGAVPKVDLSRWYWLFPLLLIILIVGGPLGEEIGWRGFLLPRLLRKFQPLIASLITGIFWFVWHLPLFYLPGAAQEGSSIAGYSLFFISISVLFTWLYIRTNGNTFAAILFHTGLNTASACYPFVVPELARGKVVDYIFLALTWIAAAILIVVSGRTLGYTSERR